MDIRKHPPLSSLPGRGIPSYETREPECDWSKVWNAETSPEIKELFGKLKKKDEVETEEKIAFDVTETGEIKTAEEPVKEADPMAETPKDPDPVPPDPEPVKTEEPETLPDGRKLNEYGEYEFDDEFEEKLIALVARDQDFFTKCGHLIKNKYFSSQMARDLATIIDEYRAKYGKEIDKAILKNEVRTHYSKYRHRGETVDDYLASVDRMFDLNVKGMSEYAADKVINFLRRRQLKISLKFIASKVTGEELGLEECRGKIEEALDIGKELTTLIPTINLTFPRDVFKGFIKKFADTFSKYFESPYEYWVFNSATFLGSIITRKVRLEISLRVEPRLYVALIGLSGNPKKSESMRQTDYLFDDYFRQNKLVKNLYVCRSVGSANGLAKVCAKKNPITLLWIDELRGIFQKMKIQSSVLLDTINSLFDDMKYSNWTSSEEVEINDASISICGATTIDIWETMFDSAGTGMGLVNRFWIVPGESDKAISMPNMPETERLKVMVELTKLLAKYSENETTTLNIETDAYELWDKWYQEFKKDKDNSTSQRIQSYGYRFMMIMAVSEGKTSIDADLITRVIRLLEWQKKVRLIYQPSEFSNLIAKIENDIRKAGKVQNEWKRSDLSRKVHAERCGLDVFNRVLMNLEKAEELRIENKGKKQNIKFLVG
jgi:hypothetical protein